MVGPKVDFDFDVELEYDRIIPQHQLVPTMNLLEGREALRQATRMKEDCLGLASHTREAIEDIIFEVRLLLESLQEPEISTN